MRYNHLVETYRDSVENITPSNTPDVTAVRTRLKSHEKEDTSMENVDRTAEVNTSELINISDLIHKLDDIKNRPNVEILNLQHLVTCLRDANFSALQMKFFDMLKQNEAGAHLLVNVGDNKSDLGTRLIAINNDFNWSWVNPNIKKKGIKRVLRWNNKEISSTLYCVGTSYFGLTVYSMPSKAIYPLDGIYCETSIFSTKYDDNGNRSTTIPFLNYITPSNRVKLENDFLNKFFNKEIPIVCLSFGIRNNIQPFIWSNLKQFLTNRSKSINKSTDLCSVTGDLAGTKLVDLKDLHSITMTISYTLTRYKKTIIDNVGGYAKYYSILETSNKSKSSGLFKQLHSLDCFWNKNDQGTNIRTKLADASFTYGMTSHAKSRTAYIQQLCKEV